MITRLRARVPAVGRWTASALAVRATVVLCGVVMIAISLPLPGFWIVLLVPSVLIAAANPERLGASLAVLVGIGSWLASFGLHGSPPLARTIVFAVALYLLHSSTALAAAVPLTCRLQPAAAVRWLSRCGAHLAVAAVLVAASYSLTALTPQSGFGSAGLVGAVLLLVVVAMLANRSSRP